MSARDTATPRVSVLMPAFNAERHIGAAIESLVRQSFSAWELMIVDDGSTDATLSVCVAHAAKDARISIVTGMQKGQSARRNVALKMARGEYIAMLDADDVAHRHRLRLQWALLHRWHRISVVGSFRRSIDDEGRPSARFRYRTDPVRPAAIRRALLRRNVLIHSSVMLRRTAFEEVGGFPERRATAEDYFLWLTLRRAGHRMANGPWPLVDYRSHPANISATKRAEQQIEALEARLLVTSGRAPVDDARRAGMFAIEWHHISRLPRDDAAKVAALYAALPPPVRRHPEMSWFHARALAGCVRRHEWRGAAKWAMQGLLASPIGLADFLRHRI